MSRSSLRIAGALVGGLLIGAAIVGCHQVEGLVALQIDPPYTVLPLGSNSVILTVSGGSSNTLALPIQWEVLNTNLGYIAGASGYSALYVRHAANGDNAIVARDGYGNEGFATVSQVKADNGPTLSKSRADTNTWTITVVSGGSGGPYEWWVRDPAIGTIKTAGTGSSIVYSVTDQSGRNDVYVRDRKGNIGGISVP